MSMTAAECRDHRPAKVLRVAWRRGLRVCGIEDECNDELSDPDGVRFFVHGGTRHCLHARGLGSQGDRCVHEYGLIRGPATALRILNTSLTQAGPLWSGKTAVRISWTANHVRLHVAVRKRSAQFVM